MTRTTHMCTLTQAYTTALSILGIPGNLLYSFLGCKQNRASEKHLQALGGHMRVAQTVKLLSPSAADPEMRVVDAVSAPRD